MDVIYYITSDQAAAYSAVYDSGPDSYMAKWRALKRSNRFKPRGIPLEAWIFLAGPVNKHRAVVGMKPKKPKKKAMSTAPALPPKLSTSMAYTRMSYRPPKPGLNVCCTKTTTDISADCLQYLIHNGYGKEQASALVKRCKDLKCTRYRDRDSLVRRLTLPDEPTNRCTSLSQWVKTMKENHPPQWPLAPLIVSKPGIESVLLGCCARHSFSPM